MQKVKISKRQLKEDQFTSFMLTARHQVLEYWQFIVIGLVVLVLLIVGVVYFFNAQTAKKSEASEKLSAALLDYRSGSMTTAIAALNAVVTDYGSEPSAEFATFLLGNANLRIRNYSEATRFFEMYLAKYKGDSFHRASAQSGIAAAAENQGDFAKAADAFESAYNEEKEGAQAGDFLSGAVRNHLAAGNIDRARSFLDILKKDFEGTDLTKRTIRLFAEKTSS
ncbi:MAG: tetratricopeptide repeat protein [Candidatus Zixiibacteriota bacterium]